LIEAFDIILRVKRGVPRDEIAMASAESLQLLARLAESR
jgi:hypothetical protein